MSLKFLKTKKVQLSKNEEMSRMSIVKDGDKKMKLKDIEAINEMMRKQLKDDRDKYTIYLHGITTHPICLKSYDDDDINFDDVDDYINGLVKKTGKFKEFFRAEILYHKFTK